MNQEIILEDLEKVYVDLPNNNAVGGESLWAKNLGNNLYEIHNVPFYAYGINYFDIVEVDSSDETVKPVVTKVVKSSGYATLRVFFGKDFDRISQRKLFDELKKFKADVERASEKYVALFIEPDGDFETVFNRLLELEKTEVLEFETCEAKNENNFDVAD
jgi:Domain of unknown function (DUF4265)